MESVMNRLQHETSPYLLQHAGNPVHWYPWCDEAFERAKAEDKPVFLSIGYSTCHWCHVMAHESFEDDETAALLNRYFIAIKVDREERPDIDSVYMSVCQAMTGSGGWPTSIWMTAEQKPFFAGTYFPRRSRSGMLGFQELLTAIHHAWTTNRAALLAQSEGLLEALSQSDQPRADDGAQRGAALLDTALHRYERTYDRRHGGFGRAPKFPSPHNLLFLLSDGARRQHPSSLDMAEHTLMQMYRGGLFDHIGGGFSRYSTDERFLVPHFEKMLYDNALLILACCRAHAVTADAQRAALFLQIARKTADYVLRELTSPEGGFYSAQDADSEGEEGKYYTFTPEEIESLLAPQDAAAFCRRFDISSKGNFEGRSIPNLLDSDPFDRSFDGLLPPIYQYRKTRYALHLDDKILTAWNGWMIAALCALYLSSGEERYRHAAQKADAFIRQSLWEAPVLYASFAGGKRGAGGFLDDYAVYAQAQLALYRATLEPSYLAMAQTLCREIMKRFADETGGGFYLYAEDSERLILRPRETYDGAMPSGNSTMAFNLVQLAQLTGSGEWRDAARKQLSFLSAVAAQYPTGYAMFLCALLDELEPPMKVTIVDDQPLEDSELLRRLPPDALVLRQEPTEAMPMKNGRTTFYVCEGRRCHPPVNDLKEIL